MQSILRIGTSTLPQNYTLNGIPLDNVQDMRDLGVTIDSKLNFHSHSTYIVSKANRMLGLIRKSFENISIQALPMLYKSLVRPIFEGSDTKNFSVRDLKTSGFRT